MKRAFLPCLVIACVLALVWRPGHPAAQVRAGTDIGDATGTSLLVTGTVQTSATAGAAVFGSTSSGGSAHFGAFGGGVAYLGNTSNFGASVRVSDADLKMRKDICVSWSSDFTSFGTSDVIQCRDAAGILAQKDGANAQTIRVYGNTTGAKYLSLSHDGTNPILGSSSGGLKADSTAITPASSGTRYLCINTAGLITSSASACSGT
jgi:hypothetical protein